ncbi:MAG: ankyrin repeat domain-containing protein, partial [Proteobacteria bacterium]|nr:ankyrin repeat domain-containing protein [Pseudomonadota bacterium]
MNYLQTHTMPLLLGFVVFLATLPAAYAADSLAPVRGEAQLSMPQTSTDSDSDAGVQAPDLLPHRRAGGAESIFARGDISLITAQKEFELFLSKYIVMFDKGKDTDNILKLGPFALRAAAFTGNIAFVEKLINFGIEIDRHHEGGITPLMAATSAKQIDIVKFLLGAGANVNAKDDMGFTTLMVCNGIGNAEIARLLMENGADVN